MVICNPAVVYEGISDFIFDEIKNPVVSLRLQRWGLFSTQEMVKTSKAKPEENPGQLAVDKLLIILQHLGIIAPVAICRSATPTTDKTSHLQRALHSEYIIPCRLDASLDQLNMQNLLEKDQACSIVPLRIHFACGFAPMGGFCYLFTKLISNNLDKGWELLLPKVLALECENDIYWRNKVTFKVNEKYFVTFLSTTEYYEIHITHSQCD